MYAYFLFEKVKTVGGRPGLPGQPAPGRAQTKDQMMLLERPDPAVARTLPLNLEVTNVEAVPTTQKSATTMLDVVSIDITITIKHIL